MVISQPTQKLISRYRTWYQSLQPKEGILTIHVDEVASRVAAFYEKIRGVVDWREEHLMRRAAIERILKRRLLIPKPGKEVASPLVLELIRGGHFPNDRIEESKIQDVEKLIDKYIFILEKSSDEKTKISLYAWILGIAACEIEETLSSSQRERALIDYMEELMRERIQVRGVEMSEEERANQIFIAVQRALFKLDSPIITFNLLKRKYPRWLGLSPTDFELKNIAENIYSIWDGINRELSHSLAEKFYKVCERLDTSYLILGDILSEDPLSTGDEIKEPEFLENKTAEAYQKRSTTLSTRLKRAAVYATLSIFVSKMLLAFAVEVPFDKYVTGQYSDFTLMLNILIPPLLMFFIVLTIRPPKKENLQQVIMEVMKIAYQRERKEVETIKPPSKRGLVMNLFVTLFYLLTFFASFGGIIYGLNRLNFGVLSIAIFLIFISLISFAGMKIRERARELEVSMRREGFFMIFFDLFAVPILRVGKWLSGQWARFNILVVLFNFLIDMPFQSFVEFLEQWRAFLKEKKEEIH